MTENTCPSTSPIKGLPCVLEDEKAAHKIGHESAQGVDGVHNKFIAWPVRNEDYERWDNEGGAVQDE